MPRTPRALDTDREEALVTAAARHFADHGYDGASLNQIIEAAGWGKSSFYHYFADKRSLFDHVVRTLRGRLSHDVRLPGLDDLTTDDFWPAMAHLVSDLTRAAHDSPETRFLGRMFHQTAMSATTGDQLARLRTDVAEWLRAAVIRGRELGAIRDDVDDSLLVELATAVLMTLDRWAVEHESAALVGPDVAPLSLRLVRDLLGATPRRSPRGSPRGSPPGSPRGALP